MLLLIEALKRSSQSISLGYREGGGEKVVKDTSVVARSLLGGRGRTRIPVFSNASAERVSVIVVAEF